MAKPEPLVLAARAAGLFVIVLVVLGYALTLRRGAWPPGHPWSGITLITLATSSFLTAAGNTNKNQSTAVLSAAGIVFLIVGAISWSIAWLIALR